VLTQEPVGKEEFEVRATIEALWSATRKIGLALRGCRSRRFFIRHRRARRQAYASFGDPVKGGRAEGKEMFETQFVFDDKGESIIILN